MVDVMWNCFEFKCLMSIFTHTFSNWISSCTLIVYNIFWSELCIFLNFSKSVFKSLRIVNLSSIFRKIKNSLIQALIPWWDWWPEQVMVCKISDSNIKISDDVSYKMSRMHYVHSTVQASFHNVMICKAEAWQLDCGRNKTCSAGSRK